MQASDRKGQPRTALADRLRDPLRLRLLITAAVLLAGYAGIYLPLGGRIEETSRRLAEEKKRQDLAVRIERMRSQVAELKDRIPEGTDTNEWVQHVLGGVRSFPLRLIALDSAPTRRVGPYQAVVLRIELEGSFRDLDAFLCWLETNERLFRVDIMRIASAQNGKDGLVMKLTVLGMMG